MEKKFNLKNGDLTDYALACGYLQVWNSEGTNKYYSGKYSVMLERTEGCRGYHIRVRKNMELTFSWETFDNLTDARKAFAKHKKELRELK